jgi:isopentenyl-diphosphate Delta-isomerase
MFHAEHEVDYVLFIRSNVSLNPNPEEVAATRYVTQTELAEMMVPSSGLKWSPWFRIIAEKWLGAWWSDLDGALEGEARHVDHHQVHTIL